jgi:hypothetical protein
MNDIKISIRTNSKIKRSKKIVVNDVNKQNCHNVPILETIYGIGTYNGVNQTLD